MALFASTSPSYLILQSLDYANKYLSDGYREKLSSFVTVVDNAKKSLSSMGYSVIGNEPLKITINAKDFGYLGTELSDILQIRGVVSEFADPDFIVFMLTPENGDIGVERLVSIMASIPEKDKILMPPPHFSKAMQNPQWLFSLQQARHT